MDNLCAGFKSHFDSKLPSNICPYNTFGTKIFFVYALYLLHTIRCQIWFLRSCFLKPSVSWHLIITCWKIIKRDDYTNEGKMALFKKSRSIRWDCNFNTNSATPFQINCLKYTHHTQNMPNHTQINLIRSSQKPFSSRDPLWRPSAVLSVSRRLWKRSLQDGVSRVNEKLGCRPVSFTCKALVEFMLCSWWPDQILQTVIWQAKSHSYFGGKHLPVQSWRAVYTST